MYSRYLQNSYRQARSVFYQPPTDELRTVLEFLAEKDVVHRTSHQLRLAELAWDLGDEQRFVELASAALLHSGEAGTTGRFDFDFSAPGRVIFLLIESLWRKGAVTDAQWWCNSARQSGYLDPKSRYYSRRLEMVVRKVEGPATATAAASESRGG
jgi:hypothetical protein